jgi:hypothetical protein
MMDTFKPSQQALNMLADLDHMEENDIEWLQDMTFGIAATMQDIRAKIENPPTHKQMGCQVIHLGSELFRPIRELKQQLELGPSLDDYIRGLDEIICQLEVVVDKNHEFMYNEKVRVHMKQITNAIIVHLEAGAVLNFLLRNFSNQEQ